MRGQLLPAIRFETFLETIYGLQRSGQANNRGVPSPIQAAVIFYEFSREWCRTSSPLQSGCLSCPSSP
jgi:hypothetical protein